MQGRRSNTDWQADLIGYELGLCDPAEASAIAEALLNDERLIQTRANVARVLAVLNADEGPPIPATLESGILAKVEQLHRTLPLRPVTTGAEIGGPSRPMFNLRELLSLAAVIAIFVGIFVPGYHTARENARMATCASNLGQLYKGGRSYAETYGTQPFMASVPEGMSWVTADNRHTTNSPNAIGLVSHRFVTPSDLICPASPSDFPINEAQIGQLQGFPDPRNNSYSFNLVSNQAQWRRTDPESPLAADLTPRVDAQRRLKLEAPISLNSNNHGGKGQNVLKINGHVLFSKTPNVGIDNDDIYSVIGVQKYTGMERPMLRSDAFLVP
jgi:hypothetical protein